ncbi:MAG: 16S rRNA (guanine(966)-N(2))-methyltransferase RsmD [Clostridia bacterium]
MRIISGEYRGKALCSFKTELIRPTADKVKQALFTKFQFDIEGCSFLDLFAGTGAIGIEAISRGANKVVFVDNNEESVALIKANLKSINCSKNVFTSDYKGYLKKCTQKFDFIFIDPPYAHVEAYDQALKNIFEKDILEKDGVIICEHSSDFAIKNTSFDLFCQKKYGLVTLSYFKLKEELLQ